MDPAGSYPFELSYGAMDDLLAGALFGTWSTDVLKNGSTAKSFTFEETVELGATDSFSRFTGAMVDRVDLNISAREAVTGSMQLMAQKETLGAAIISGATYTAAPTEPVSTASANVADLSVASLSPVPFVRSLTLQIANNLRTRPTVSSLYSEQFGAGRCEVTGTLNTYFSSDALYAAALAHGGGALAFTVGNETLKQYTFELPKIIFGNAERQVGGNNDDVMASIQFRAVWDVSEACSIKITRAVA